MPGALAAYEIALERCGTIKLARALAPGIKAAADGFVVDAESRRRDSRHGRSNLKQFEGSRAVFFQAGRQAARSGRPARADAIWPTRIGRSRSTASTGSIAARSRRWSATGWPPTAASSRPPISPRTKRSSASRSTRPIAATRSSAFRRPAPAASTSRRSSTSSSTSTCEQIGQRDPVEATHIIAEAFKLAFADRAYWLGDADFVDVPRGLIDKDYAKELAAKIDPKRAIDVPTHGSPPNWRQDLFGRHTTHIAAADAAGNWVAITATVNTTFGSKVIVPGTGVVLNNEMDDFSIYPGMPNAFGLVGAENNSVAPGKRPLSSMSPTIVLDKRRQADADGRRRGRAKNHHAGAC